MGEERQKEKRLISAAQVVESSPGQDLEAIFREHSQRVLRAAYRVTGSADDSQDVLQTVFLRLARREGGAGLSDSPGNYLHRAAINAALDVVRSRHSARTTPLETVESMLPDAPERSPERVRDSGEIREKVLEALARLSPKAAEVFTLRYFEGYGNHEIAKLLGTSRSTINVILHRARGRLREELASCFGDSAFGEEQ